MIRASLSLSLQTTTPLLAISAGALLAVCAGCSDDSEGNESSMGGAATAAAGSGGSATSTAGSGAGGTAGSIGMAAPGPGDAALNGISLPTNVEDWPVLAVHSRTDNGQIRVVLGNEIAATAARSGNTSPWPDGTMLADLAWAGGTNPDWLGLDDKMKAPDTFGVLLLMVKDAASYAESGGWGYASWTGTDLTPSADPNFDQACISCHTSSAIDNDYVFTRPGALPTAAQITAAADTLNGMSVPAGIRDWRLIGATHRTDNGSVRVTIGNDAAVTAARAGAAYPDGSMLADFVWTGGTNSDFELMVGPTGFGALILMEKDAATYAADGGWRYGNWATAELTPAAAADFDRACVTCHTENAMDNDYIFTRPALLPGSGS